MNIDIKKYRINCLLGSMGALLMLVGDLCLSVVPANNGDSGLFMREAYFDGAFSAWRLPLLLASGLLGMALCAFSVWACYNQVLPQYRKTRALTLISGVIYLTSAGVIHFIIGSLADWTGVLSPLLGKSDAAALIQAQYERLVSAMALPYAGMVILILTNAYAVASGKTVLPRKMLVFHMLVWQIIFVLIPDMRQLFDAEISTWDFVLSQGSGNAALFIWIFANAVWAFGMRKIQKQTEIKHYE